MLPESDKMKTTTAEVNNTAVKTESTEVKEEIKEEPPSQNNGGSLSNNNNAGPPSNKITNGETESVNPPTSTESAPAPAPPQPVKKEPAQTLADVLNEESHSPIAKPFPPPGRSPGNPQSAPMKTSHHSPQEGPSSVPAQPPVTTSRAPSRPHSQPTTGTIAETHYTQQQSQIFVFSTQMANEAADNVMAGQYKSILSYHMDQPSTKKFLQKHAMKIGPVNGPPTASQARSMRQRHMGAMKGQGGFPPNSSASVAQWVQQQNAHLQEQGYNFPQGMPPQGNPMMMGGARNHMMLDGYEMEMMGMGSQNPNILSHQKVPNENLTPEQLKRREESLTNLRKIQQMLFPEQRGGQMPYGPGQGPPGQCMESGQMMPEGMRNQMLPGQEMLSPPHGMSQDVMRSQHEMNMMSPDGMMGSPNSMMGMSQFGGPGPGPGGGMGVPPHGPRGPGSHMQNMNPAQREWYRLQHEFYMEKRRHHQQQMAQRMGQPNMEMAGSANGPPPSYFSSIAQKHGSVGINSSTSSSSNGPLGSPPLVSQGYDPHEMGMFPQGPGRSMEQASMGPMPPGFDPMMPNMPPGGMMPGMGSPMHGKRAAQTQFHRAGQPEPFLPEIATSQASASGGGVKKPPPSYAQSQKRRRSEIEEDIFKNLQPAPSPQQINYLNQFEGQELTITKQLNSAYRDPNAPSDTQSHSNQFSQNHVPHSPMHVPTSKGPMSNSSQTSSVGPLSSPGPIPGPNPMSGANMRLSHFDPPPPSTSIVSSSMNSNSTSVTSSAPPTPTSKSSMTNITSSSLADLAKGVEHLQNQMQQNMMQGGPFHSIQMQGQQAGGSTSGSGNVTQSNNSVCTKSSDISSHTQTTPSVNNTYVNATMSIQQLNIQSVNAPGGPNYNPSMQIQQMNMDHNLPGGPSHNPQQGAMTTASMSQSQAGTMAGSGNPNVTMNKTQFSQHQQQVSAQIGSGTMMAQQQHQQTSQPQSAGRPGSPSGFSGSASAMGNANVQIQAKAPNTIQYLPAHPPANQPNNGPPKRPDLDFMQRFAAPLGNVDSKVPTSKMQYFPNPHEQNMRGGMSPYSGGPQGGQVGPVGMSQPMMQGGGPNGPDFPPHGMGPGSGPSGSMMGLSDMMGSPEALGGPMGNMHPGMMPGGPPENMMHSGMRMSPGVMGMDNVPPSGGMGPLSHQGSPPYSMGREPVMGGGMMQRGMMNSNGPMSDMMPSGPGRMNPMGTFGPRGGPMNPGMRMPGPGGPSMTGMPSSGMGGMPGGPNFNPGYQQFQQQLYSQGRPRQMSPMDGMMGGPGGQYMGMMSNMPGP